MVTMKGRILYIEDDSMMRGLLSEKLVEAGYDVSAAEDGTIGLRMAAENTYDLILLDLLLPGLDGHEVVNKLKDTANKNAPIIVLSNLEAPKANDTEHSEGVAMHMVKASHLPEEIVEAVKQTLQK